MNHTCHAHNMMSASASHAEASFSCADIALTMDAILLASILIILGILVCLCLSVSLILAVLAVLAVLVITCQLNRRTSDRPA